MHSSWFEQMRFPLESIEVLQRTIVSEMLALKDNPKQKSIAENKIFNFMEMAQQKSKDAVAFYREETAMRKEQMMIIDGSKNLKGSENKKASDVIWQNFYEKVREIKEYYKKNESSLPLEGTDNTIDFFRRVVFMAPYKEPEFSSEENKGRYVDMHSVYLEFINLCKVLEDKDKLKINDYLWFLQNFDKFDDFALNKKMKHHYKYLNYLKSITTYLYQFIRRSKPLFHLDDFLSQAHKEFESKFEEGRVLGWENENDNFDEEEWQYCVYCEKLLTSRDYITHVSGKNHLKKMKIREEAHGDEENKQDPEKVKEKEEEKEKQEIQRYKANHLKRKKELAFEQFKIIKMREEIANTVYDTMNLVRKKQTRGYEDIEEIEEESSESEEADAPIYNPKNLPLGWDGKPIPYWLYKLHGLGIEYKCQICGNFSYWGRRAFQMHFQEWRHNYGMKCLKIPNTIHFKDVTSINDAIELHEKLVRESKEAQFRPDVEEEFEDNEGNILNKRTYLDMKKQGLIS